ncbi:type II toxin-antitoxin system RelB/DinJ family antitoxin [Candidatus Halobeggiatoa sp. HSG11]|nr:type II toxin-antitoxin system RelB/DinJ family antitoxin [Candidatus Halobeggiatoa sp. HSG11]
MTTITVKKTTSVKLDEETKEEAKKVFKQLGLTMSEAFNLFLYQVKLNQGLPFEVKIPNKSTRKVLDDVRQGKNVEPLSLEDLKLP